jgi:phage shock protein PspC (stress-responsive transcriptional regulator)
MKKLTRSKTNAVFAGVIGGFGEYFGVDATMLRVVFVFFVLVTGLFPGVFAYVFAILLMPLAGEPTVHTVYDEKRG